MLNNAWNTCPFDTNLLLFLVAILGTFLLGGCGSHPDDISGTVNVKNPLPPCPDSPNCIRLTKKVPDTPLRLYGSVLKATQQMNPEHINSSKKSLKINSVFKVFLFRDDMDIQIISADSTNSHLHIRSASRTGESDLGVNTRRVKKFLNLLPYSFDLK